MKNQIPLTEYCYIAGYIDGDGCFYIGKEKSQKRLSQKDIVSIVISSVNKIILDHFKISFGGSVSLVKKAYDNSKPIYQFSVKKRDTINLAQQILPYLVEKKQECQMVIDFILSQDPTIKNIYINKIKILKNVENLVYKHHKEEFEKFKQTVIPTETDFAYLAGFIDAECSFNIQKYKPKDRPNFVYKILLQCNNTKAPVFKWLLERFGGQIHFIDRNNHNKAKRNQLAWRLSGKALFKFIQQIHPFLKYKQPVCEELINFYKTTLRNGGARHTDIFRRNYEEVIKIRESIVSKVHLLNLKGNNS